jgi:hypothetical protein
MRLALAENLLLGWLLGRVRSGAQLEMQVMPFAKAGMVLSAPRNFVVVASSDTAAEADLAANMDGRVLKFVDDIHYEKEQLIQQLRRFSAPCTHCFGRANKYLLFTLPQGGQDTATIDCRHSRYASDRSHNDCKNLTLVCSSVGQIGFACTHIKYAAMSLYYHVDNPKCTAFCEMQRTTCGQLATKLYTCYINRLLFPRLLHNWYHDFWRHADIDAAPLIRMLRTANACSTT